MKKKYTDLTKNVGLFAISGFVPKILAFLLIPIYTDCLTTGEYGISDLITTTVELLLPIFTLDIQDAVVRFAMDKAYDRKDVLSNAVKIVLIGTVLVALGAIGAYMLKIPGVEPSYLLFFVLMYFMHAAYNTVSLFCRGIDKVHVLVTGSVLQSVITLTANILFLMVFRWGLTGYLIANTIGFATALIFCFFKGKLYQFIKWRPSKAVRKDMIIYSFPLIFSVISWWVNKASDRYILTWLVGVEISGIYAVAYKIPHLLSMFQNIFAQAWAISAVKEFDKEDSDGFMSNMYGTMNFAMVFVCSGIMLLDIPLAKILYANEFFEAWKYVPPLLISVVFNAMGLFIGSIFTAVKDTRAISVSTIIGAVVNTVCNVVLIWKWGAYGAAIATMIGYFVIFLMRSVFLRKYVHLKLNWLRDGAVYGLLLAQMVLASLGLRFIWLQLPLLLAVLLLYWKESKGFFTLIRKKLLKRK